MKKNKCEEEHREKIEIDGIKLSLCYGKGDNPELIKAMRNILIEQLAVNKSE